MLLIDLYYLDSADMASQERALTLQPRAVTQRFPHRMPNSIVIGSSRTTPRQKIACRKKDDVFCMKQRKEVGCLCHCARRKTVM